MEKKVPAEGDILNDATSLDSADYLNIMLD